MGHDLGRRLWLWAICALIATATGVSSAQEQESFGLDQFQPAPAGDRFFGVQGGDTGGHAKPRFMLLGDYAYRPLVLYRNDGDSKVGDVVRHHLFVHVGLALGLWERVNLSLDVPVALVTKGRSPEEGGVTFASPSGAALGDLRFGARVRVLGDPEAAIGLGFAGYLWLPTGNQDKFAGDGSVRGMPAVVVDGQTGIFAYAANLGIALRPEATFANTTVSKQLSYGAAVGLLLADKKLQIGPEFYGNFGISGTDRFDASTSNLEGILGARYRVGAFVAGGGVGPGFTRAIGTPALRAVGSFGYAPEPDKKPPPPEDRDGDGIVDSKDACPDDPGEPSDDPEVHGCPDLDGDTIRDPVDACPEVPGVASDDPAHHGCPPDTDGDGIIDDEDACPKVRGIENDDPEKNGCPPDRDDDGIVDELDACPDLKGVASADPEQNGCPPDTDGDGIRDDQDACPREKGPEDPDPQKNGCPTLVRVTEKEIVILQQVQFKTASAEILPESDELLEQVADVLRDHPEILEVEVQGHTDDRGANAYNQKLSERRAASVVSWLTTRGNIDASRLMSRGYGEDQPVADNKTPEGRQTNRRVQFSIVRTEKKTEQSEEAP